MLSISASDLGIRIPLHFVVILLLGKLSAYANLSYVSTFLSLSLFLFLIRTVVLSKCFCFTFAASSCFTAEQTELALKSFEGQKKISKTSHLGSTWWPSVLRWVFSMSLSSRISLASSVSTWVSAAQVTYPVLLAHWVDQSCLCFTLCAPALLAYFVNIVIVAVIVVVIVIASSFHSCVFFLLTPKLLAIFLAHGLP